MTDRVMTQTAPWPDVLAELVAVLKYKPGWHFALYDLDRGQGSKGLTLVITIHTPDSYAPERTIAVAHYMLVPPAAYDGRSWQRWLFEQILLVERHEACEFFQIVEMDWYKGQDGEQHRIVNRPYAPSHGPGNDPYLIREVGTEPSPAVTVRLTV
jgi:hypothetical protein